MSGLRFERQAPVVASDPNRVDVACFVGLVGRRGGALPSSVRTWLEERGWLKPKDGSAPYARPDAADLLDVPVPVDTWEVFDRLFAWDRRDLDGQGHLGATYLGTAVRSFFAQGGRKCYVVRAADPLPHHASKTARDAALAKLVPGFAGGPAPSPAARATWTGAGHVLGLPDVSFLCLPDLADLVKAVPAPPKTEPKPVPPAEDFVECSGVEAPPEPDGWARLLAAPRCDEDGYELWEKAVRLAGRLVVRHRREVQLVAAIPLPVEGSAIEADLAAFLYGQGWLAKAGEPLDMGLASAFVQLAWPWVKTRGSGGLPEQLESPDGVLTGVLARNALARGTFRSAAGLPLGDAYDVYPRLRRDQMERPWKGPERDEPPLAERVSLVGPTPSGLRLLSDVTTSTDPGYRPACVNRLVAVLVRTARRLGEDSAFEASGETLWGRVRNRMATVLQALYEAGALRGATPAEAYQVRCDRSTMSQQDLDQGRVVAQVRFEAAMPIESITVVLSLDEGGRLSLPAEGAAA